MVYPTWNASIQSKISFDISYMKGVQTKVKITFASVWLVAYKWGTVGFNETRMNVKEKKSKNGIRILEFWIKYFATLAMDVDMWPPARPGSAGCCLVYRHRLSYLMFLLAWQFGRGTRSVFVLADRIGISNEQHDQYTEYTQLCCPPVWGPPYASPCAILALRRISLEFHLRTDLFRIHIRKA